MDCVHPRDRDDDLEAGDDARASGSWNGEPLEEGDEIDPELEAWLIAREAELDEQRFALADQFDEEWAR